MAEEVKLNYIMPAIEEAGWSKKQIRMEYYLLVRGICQSCRLASFTKWSKATGGESSFI